jgi:hypothetical protein
MNLASLRLLATSMSTMVLGLRNRLSLKFPWFEGVMLVKSVDLENLA